MDKRLLLASPHMSDEGYELEYIHDAFQKNWIAPLGENVNEFEKAMGTYMGKGYPVALSAGTAALHLAMILAGVKRGDARLFAVLLVKDLRDAVAQGRFGAVRPGAVVGVQLCLPAQRLRQPRETRGHGILLGIDA